jgi:hypothetical protein
MAHPNLERGVQNLGYESYSAYLNSDHWKNVKRRWRKKYGYKCKCGATYGLQLHHLSYNRLGKEELEDLVYLCGPCHTYEHFKAKEIRKVVVPEAPRTVPRKKGKRKKVGKKPKASKPNQTKNKAKVIIFHLFKKPPGLYTTEELAEITGLTTRQVTTAMVYLDQWDKRFERFGEYWNWRPNR